MVSGMKSASPLSAARLRVAACKKATSTYGIRRAV